MARDGRWRRSTLDVLLRLVSEQPMAGGGGEGGGNAGNDSRPLPASVRAAISSAARLKRKRIAALEAHD